MQQEICCQPRGGGGCLDTVTSLASHPEKPLGIGCEADDRHAVGDEIAPQSSFSMEVVFQNRIDMLLWCKVGWFR